MTPSAASLRLLLVDDDPLTCELLSTLLRREGFHVTSAESELVAISLFEQVRGTPAAFDAVLTDLQMPGEGGVGLARRLRRESASLVLAGMSARQATAEEEAAFDVFFRKPFLVEGLRSALQQAAQARRETDAAADRPLPGNLESPSADSTGSDSATASGRSSGPQASSSGLSLEPEAELLDSRITAQLRSVLGDTQWKQLLEITLLDVEQRLAMMRSSLVAKDTRNVRTEAHVIRGSCGMVGALQLSQVATSLEESSELDTSLFDVMQKACEALRSMVTIVPP